MTRTVGVAALLAAVFLVGGWGGLWVKAANAQSGGSVTLSARPALPNEAAYRQSGFRTFIEGGQPAANSVFKLVVEIEFGPASQREVCSGTFVSRHQVLTAGHCGCADPGSYIVRVDGDNGPARFGVRGVVLYDPRVCASTDVSGRDLALLDTETDLDCRGGDEFKESPTLPKGNACPAQGPALMIATQFAPKIESVWSLRSQLTVGRSLVAVGYGLDENGRYGARLMANIPILSFTCEDPWLRYFCAPFAEMILADRASARARDTCPGDSGGPVYLFGPDNKTVQLIAVVSRAAPLPQDAQGCGGGGIYELIGRQSVINWLGANNIPDKTIVPQGVATSSEIPPDALAKLRKGLENLRN